MTTKMPLSTSNEWLRLETAVELIGQMIANKVASLAQEVKKGESNQKVINQIEEQIIELGIERRACYLSKTKDAAIDKAYNVYAPQLNALK